MQRRRRTTKCMTSSSIIAAPAFMFMRQQDKIIGRQLGLTGILRHLSHSVGWHITFTFVYIFLILFIIITKTVTLVINFYVILNTNIIIIFIASMWCNVFVICHSICNERSSHSINCLFCRHIIRNARLCRHILVIFTLTHLFLLL